jgi:hypothetical protein
MSPVVLLAALCGQFTSPQQPAAAPPTHTLMLLQHTPPAAAPAPPSVLVANPPLWDRMAAGLGKLLTDRAARHQHAKPAQLVTVTPVVVQTQPATTPALIPAHALPAPQSAAVSEAVPTPANFQPPAPTPTVIVVPDPPGPLSPRRLFGSG